MAWIWLTAAGLMEIAWVIGMKRSEGFTRPWASAWTIAGMIVSFVLLAQALRSIPVGTAYAVWTGIGAAGAVVAGIACFGESRDPLRLFCAALIVAGIVGLKLCTKP